MKKKIEISNDEINNVAGGKGWGGSKKIICPSCGRQVLYSRAHQYDESKGCSDTVEHYKCPECNHEWTETH